MGDKGIGVKSVKRGDAWDGNNKLKTQIDKVRLVSNNTSFLKNKSRYSKVCFNHEKSCRNKSGPLPGDI
jgi:hypothetical protein